MHLEDKKIELFYLELLRDWVESHIGIRYHANNISTLHSKLVQLCWQQNIADLKALFEYLQTADSDNIGIKIAQAVSTTHTFFFRELETLSVFKDLVLPSLITKEPLKIWSAAASSGQEAYTLAMIVAEYMGLENMPIHLSILGTDINQLMIKQAEKGIYSSSALDMIETPYKDKYFKPVGLEQYQIHDVLRRSCLFRRLNLTSKSWPFTTQFQVVFCRNILYYFSMDQQAELLRAIYSQTSENGFLFTSVTESLSALKTPWKMIQPGIYQKLSP